MAINFPSSPTNGQQHTVGQATWTYNTAQTKWRISRTAASVASATAPTSPQAGQLWFDTDTGALYVYYEDGTSNQWVEVGSFSDLAFLDEDDMASNSATAVPTQQSVKAFVENRMKPTSYSMSSGTGHTITIPSGVVRIELAFDQVSLSGTDLLRIRVGDGGTVESSGYLCSTQRITTAPAVTVGTSTAAFNLCTSSAAVDSRTGRVVLTRSETGHRWVLTSQLALTAGVLHENACGSIDLTSELDTLEISASGSNTFDFGSVAVYYE